MSREEEPGVLGNLPRSRPGLRSEKRSTDPELKRVSATSRPSPPPREEDRVGDTLRTAADAAGAGLRIASGFTRELLRRLPRR